MLRVECYSSSSTRIRTLLYISYCAVFVTFPLSFITPGSLLEVSSGNNPSDLFLRYNLDMHFALVLRDQKSWIISGTFFHPSHHSEKKCFRLLSDNLKRLISRQLDQILQECSVLSGGWKNKLESRFLTLHCKFLFHLLAFGKFNHTSCYSRLCFIIILPWTMLLALTASAGDLVELILLIGHDFITFQTQDGVVHLIQNSHSGSPWFAHLIFWLFSPHVLKVVS